MTYMVKQTWLDDIEKMVKNNLYVAKKAPEFCLKHIDDQKSSGGVHFSPSFQF